MNEQYIIDQLIINHVNYQKYGGKRFEQEFGFWMNELKDIKGFDSIEEACDYYLAQGEMQGDKLTA